MALYTLDEIFQMAAQLEDSGRFFYEAVARECPNVAVAEQCRHLAAEEQAHSATFDAMRKALIDRAESRRMVLEKMEFAQALIQQRVLPLEAEARGVAEGSSVADVLDMAIQMEADSVAFYTELLSAVDAEDAAAVERIIQEEKSHDRQLREAREISTA